MECDASAVQYTGSVAWERQVVGYRLQDRFKTQGFLEGVVCAVCCFGSRVRRWVVAGGYALRDRTVLLSCYPIQVSYISSWSLGPFASLPEVPKALHFMITPFLLNFLSAVYIFSCRLSHVAISV